MEEKKIPGEIHHESRGERGVNALEMCGSLRSREDKEERTEVPGPIVTRGMCQTRLLHESAGGNKVFSIT